MIFSVEKRTGFVFQWITPVGEDSISFDPQHKWYQDDFICIYVGI